MIRNALKILQHLLQDFYCVPDNFGTLCIKGIRMKIFDFCSFSFYRKSLELVLNKQNKLFVISVESKVAQVSNGRLFKR